MNLVVKISFFNGTFLLMNTPVNYCAQTWIYILVVKPQLGSAFLNSAGAVAILSHSIDANSGYGLIAHDANCKLVKASIKGLRNTSHAD